MFKKSFPFGKFAAAFLIGAAAGAAVALLYTPLTGRKMQKQLKNVVESEVDRVHDVLKKVVG